MSKNLVRCSWCEKDDLYRKYHDEEWGVPVFDDQKIFEFLILESAQAGLSWHTILKKRDGYTKAFANFDVVKVAKFSEKKIQTLLQNPNIIRNELKVRAAVHNAKLFLNVQKEFGTFSHYIWKFVNHKPLQNHRTTLKDVPAKTPESDALAKDLKKRGFKFLGSTTIYAHMQATGMVNDHITDCHRHPEIASLGNKVMPY